MEVLCVSVGEVLVCLVLIGVSGVLSLLVIKTMNRW